MEFDNVSRNRKVKLRKERGLQRRLGQQNWVVQVNTPIIRPSLPKLERLLCALGQLRITCNLKECDQYFHIRCLNGKNIFIESGKEVEVNVIDMDPSSCELFCEVVCPYEIKDGASFFCLDWIKGIFCLQSITNKDVVRYNITSLQTLHTFFIPSQLRGKKNLQYNHEEDYYYKPAGKAFMDYRTFSSYNNRKTFTRYKISYEAHELPRKTELVFHNVCHKKIGNSWFEVYPGNRTLCSEISLWAEDEV